VVIRSVKRCGPVWLPPSWLDVRVSCPRQSEIYYSTLMRFSGRAATSHEAAANFGGDDVAVRARGDLTDTANPVEALRFLAGLGRGAEKLRVLARAPRVPGLVAAAARADCEVDVGVVALLGLPVAVSDSVLCAVERYDGNGAPAGRSGYQPACPFRGRPARARRARAGTLRRCRLRGRDVRRGRR
jgi:hypothetical protein